MPRMTQLPLPETGEVHIHCSFPAAPPTNGTLSPDEICRADQLRDSALRDQFIAYRTELRSILGSYLKQPPEKLVFTIGDHGKPRLAGYPHVHFNLSHSAGLFLLAVTRDQEVGVDCEMVRQDAPIHDLARLAFSAKERKELDELTADVQRGYFYRCWTRKEACLKGCGKGFSLPASSFSIGGHPQSAPTVINTGSETDWYLHTLAVSDGFCAALAVQTHSPCIRYIGTK